MNPCTSRSSPGRPGIFDHGERLKMEGLGNLLFGSPAEKSHGRLFRHFPKTQERTRGAPHVKAAAPPAPCSRVSVRSAVFDTAGLPSIAASELSRNYWQG
jgi:hypothetical protein